MQHGKVSRDETVGCQWSWMFTLLHYTTHTKLIIQIYMPKINIM